MTVDRKKANTFMYIIFTLLPFKCLMWTSCKLNWQTVNEEKEDETDVKNRIHIEKYNWDTAKLDVLDDDCAVVTEFFNSEIYLLRA